MSRRTLVAGLGNIFLGDDGFGVEVVARLSRERLPEDVRLMDAGIRARELAFELLDGGYETAILVDAVARGGAPGSVYLIEPDIATAGRAATAALEGHAMNPEATLAFVQALGGATTRVLIVGCEPANVEEGIGLSEPVSAAVEKAMCVVQELLCA